MSERFPLLKPGLYSGQSGGAHLWLDHDGEILSGWYSTSHGRPDEGQRFRITGCMSGPLISFAVAWRGFHSLTGWTGRVYEDEAGKPYLRCLWNLARLYSDKELTVPTEPFETFLTFSGFYYWQRDLQVGDI